MQDVQLGFVDDGKLGCGVGEGGGEEWVEGVGQVFEVPVEVLDEGFEVGFHLRCWGGLSPVVTDVSLRN